MYDIINNMAGVFPVNPMAIISITAMVAALVSGVYIFAKNPESRFNRALLVFSALIAYLSLTDFGLSISESYMMADFWVRMGFLWPMVVPIIVHMVLLFTGRRTTRPLLAVIYVPAGVIAILELTTDLITAGPTMTAWGWTFRAAEDSIPYQISNIWGLLVAAAAIILVAWHWRSSSGPERTRVYYLLTGLTLPVLTGIITDLILPSAGIVVPSLTDPAAALGVSMIAYGVMRFRLPILSPLNAAMDIVRNMNSFLIITDPELNIHYVNPAAEGLTGCRAAELTGRRLTEILEFEDICKDSTIESRLRGGDGWIPVIVSAGHVHGSGGEHVGFLFTGSDMRPILEMEEKLRRREDRLVLLTEHMADGLGEFDRDFNFRYLSPSVEKITGYGHEKLIGLSVMEFLDYLHPDDRDNVKNLIITGGEAHRATFRIRRPDGNYRWVEYVDRPIRTDGDIEGYVFGLRDIHEHKMAEEALIVSKEKFRELFRNMRSGIIVVEYDGKGFRVKSMNPAAEEMEGVSCAAIRGMDLPRALPGIWNSAIRKALLEIMETGEAIHCPEVRCGEAWFDVHLYQLSTGEVVIICTDITMRKEYEDRLRSSLREKEALLREVHHRVKNNFQIVSSLINLQMADVEDPAPLRDLQSRVQSMALVHELLYESEDLTSIDMGRYLERLTSSILDSYHGGGIDLEVEVGDVTLPIETAVPLGLIINELITNSVKHAFTSSGRITIELKEDGSEFTLTVADNGVGLPLGFVPGESDALGLRLVAGLVDQIDGTLETLGRDEGAEFRITFRVVHYRPRI